MSEFGLKIQVYKFFDVIQKRKRTMEWYIYALLFVIAIVTVHLVSWVGNVLHSVPNGGASGYAVFTFRVDQDRSMSTNILMNILFPNIVLIFMHMFCYKEKIDVSSDQLFYYVCFYYTYRIILICFILRRKELLSIHYEFTNLILGILVALFLVKKFLTIPEQVFIPISELVNEFWLVIIVLVFKFVTLIFDKIFRQNTVVNENMLDEYIRNKFKKFYRKYKDNLYITKDDNRLWLLVFSIMIFENYNRGSIIRIIEKIKIHFGFTATTGIMQIRSNKNISDEESISLAFDKLKNEIVKGNVESDDESQIEYYAEQYNPDEDYSKSVSFIYQHLYKYISDNRRLKHEFYLDNNNQGEKEKTEQQDTPICPFEENNYVTLDDIVTMSGLKKKQVWEKIKKKKVVAYFDEDIVKEVFKVGFPKG